MSTSTLYRLAAVALIVTGVATAVGYAVHPPPEPAAMTTLPWVLSHLLLWLGAVTGVAGLVGLYLRQREEVGTLGVVGGSLAAAGLGALSGAYYYEAVIVPALAAEAPALMQTFPTGAAWRTYLAVVAASGVLLALGFLLLGIAMVRAALLPRWVIILATLGAVAAGVQFLIPRPVAFLAFFTLGVGLAGLGYALWASVAASGPQPAMANNAAEAS